MAFLLAMVALAVLGLVATGGFYTVRQEFRAAVAGERASETLDVSENGLADVLANWEGERFGLLPVGATEQVPSLSHEGSALIDVRRLSERLFLLDSRGSLYGAPNDRRRIALLARLSTPNLQTGGAALTLGTTLLEGDVAVSGNDFTPMSWGGLCGATPASVPGLWVPDATQVFVTAPAGVLGSPPMLETSSLNGMALHDFGGITRAGLVAIADVRLLGGALGPTSPQTDANGNCASQISTNWGDPNAPTSACGRYFPVIHVTGDAELVTGTVGQGILVVDGDLRVAGNVRFFGAILATGHVEVEGGGTLLAGHVRADRLTMRNASTVQETWLAASRCAVERAVLNNPSLTRPEPLSSRSWLDLTALGG